jgi:hypothetical protein
MSAVPDSGIEVIYIPLLGEGLPVLRPTQERFMGSGVFLILPTPDYGPNIEHWEFPPGSKVQCVREYRDGNELLVARNLIRAG